MEIHNFVRQNLMECSNRARFLKISGTKLPNRTITSNWYKGRLPIVYLIFYWIEIIAIEANAFAMPAFEKLAALDIYNLLHIPNYYIGMFNGLLALEDLEVIGRLGEQQHLHANLLRVFRATLIIFRFQGSVATESVLTNLFGSHELPILIEIRIIDGGFVRRSLAAANFTGLSALRFLICINFGIESIEIGAFDRILDNLMTIDLTQNPLHKIHLNPFRYYLDRMPKRQSPKFLVFNWPNKMIPLNCTTEFYRIRNATIISFQYSANRSIDLDCLNDVHETIEGQQIIHPEHLHLNHHNISKYAVPKFNFDFNTTTRTLDVIQADSNGYRLFVWPINRTLAIGEGKCPSTEWIQTNVKCERRHRINETIYLSQPKNDSDLVAVCIINISLRKQSVPLHCRTIRLSRARNSIP